MNYTPINYTVQSQEQKRYFRRRVIEEFLKTSIPTACKSCQLKSPRIRRNGCIKFSIQPHNDDQAKHNEMMLDSNPNLREKINAFLEVQESGIKSGVCCNEPRIYLPNEVREHLKRF